MSLLTPNIPFKNYNPTFEEGSGSLGFIEKTTGFVSSSWKSAITQTGTRAYNRWSSQQETSGRMLSPDEANTYFPYKEKYKQPVSYDLAQLNYNSYRREIDDSTFSDTALHEWDGYLAMLLGGLTGSLLDPIEAGSGFIAGGFAASGRLGVNLFKNSSIAKRTLLKSATFGAAESVLLEPLYYALKSYNKEQYGIVDTVSNLGFGAVLGGIGGGIRLATGNYDIPIELKPETIKAVYVNGLLNAEQNIPAKILTEDANFIRSTFKEEINTLVDIEKSKFQGDISKEQEAFIRAKAERVISNGVNKEMPTAPIRKNTSVRSPNIESKTDANLVTHSEQLLNDAKQEISQYNISNEDLKTRKDRVEIEEQTANLIQENKQDPKADFIDKAQSDLDKQLVIEKAFSDTVTEFFPGVEVVNINNAKLNPSIIKNFEDKRNQAGYLPSDGKIYFNPLKIDKEEVGKLIFHEVVTHKGLDAIMTTKERAKFDKYMEKHYKQEIDKSIADGEATTRSAAIEEVIAYRFESEGIQAQEYTSYMYAKAMQVLGIDGKSMKVIDDAIIKETVYQSMKGMATQKLINRFGMFGSVDEWTKEEIFFVNKRRKDILENQKLQEEIIDAENRYFVEKKFKEAQQRGADERTKIVPRVLDKVKNIQEQLDFKLKLTKSKNQKEILKLNELSNKLLLNKTKEKLNKAIDSDKSKKSPVILKFEKHIREKQEEIKELNHTIKLFENSKSNLLNHKKDLELLDKQELALNNIQTNAINRYSKAKIKLKSVSNKKDIQNAYDELETLGLDYRTKNNDFRFRKKTPSKESKQEAIDFAKDAGQVDQDKKYKASIANLAKPSQLELDNFDNQVLPEINRVAVASKLSNNEKETLEKTLKQLTPLANANARIKLFNWFSKLPQGRRFTAIKDYIERTLDADIKHNKEFYIDRFYNKMNQKFKKKWDTKPFWKEITYAGHYLRNKSDKTLDKDILVNMRTPDSDALKAVKEIDNLNKELMGFARNVGLVVQDMEHYTGPQIWSIDRIAKNLNISITEFDIKTLSYKEMKDHKDVIANEVYKKIKDYVRWDRISTPKGDPILDANSGEAKRYIRDWISGLWDHKQSKISGTPAELGVSNSIIGAERKINFIDGDIAHDFQMKWGAENSTDALINNLESLITKTITTKHLGPSAENNLNMVIKELGETIEQGNLKIQKQRRDVENKIPISLRMMTGRHQVSDNHTLVKWLNNYRSATSALKMGNLILTSASDPVYTAKALKNLEIKGQGVSDFLKIVTRRKTREDKFLLENTYATYDGVKSASISRFDPETIGLSTAVSKFNNFAFTYNGMNWHNRTLREGFHLGAIRRMGIASKYSLSQLREMGDDAKSLVARIERSLISDDEWEVIRDSAINVKDLNGKPHAFKGKTEDSVLTWDSVLNEDIISNEQIIKLIKNTSKINNPSDIKIKRTRKELSDKLQSIIRDEMDTGILTPGVRENRIMSWGSKEGSYQNAFLKLLFQYKSFPVAMMTRHLGPTWQENSPLMAAIGISYLVAKATAVTLMVDQIKQLIDGKNVKPWNLDTLGAAIAKSGGLALIYDVLFKDYSEYGQNGVLSHLGGPGLNGISDLAGVGSQFVKDIQDGDFKSSSLKAIRAADQFTGNFPILSQIKKNMVIYPLYDLVDPQRNNRIQNLLEKNWGQKYWADWASPTGKAEVKTFEDLLNLIDNTLKNND
jgi:predicted nucleotidyltransferase